MDKIQKKRLHNIKRLKISLWKFQPSEELRPRKKDLDKNKDKDQIEVIHTAAESISQRAQLIRFDSQTINGFNESCIKRLNNMKALEEK